LTVAALEDKIVQQAVVTILNHEWTMKFVEHRVADRRILRLIPEMAEGGDIGRRPVVGE
jgi:hypothetical protein